MKILPLIIGMLFTLSMSACSSESSSGNANIEKVSENEAAFTELFQQKVLREKITDTNSPLGYWEIDLSYPQLHSKSNIAAATINESIESLVNRYRCEDGGDKSFTGKVIQMDKNILVMSYESMWMCATMPRPDSESRVVTFDLKTGEQIKPPNKLRQN